jgi:PAS domain S-box-containing protein
MTGDAPDALVEASATELFEEAPCGYLTCDLDGVIMRVNRTFEAWTGLRREALVGRVHFAELLSAGGRIYHETHYAPLLMMQGEVREVALDIVRADGSLLPALVNSVLRHDETGAPRVIRTTVFDATDRRRYEQELVAAGRREHEIARELQQSMLSGTLPVGPGFELAVFYAPADLGLDIGGDWYDAFWVSSGTLGLVIGDVVGRGIGAAAVMGQLRSAVRALAATGLSPARLLEAMDAYSHRHEVGHTTTILYAQVQLATGRLEFACAGHPPPVIVGPDGEPAFLWSGRSWPLDAPAAGARRASGTHTLAPGSLLLLYTDGLVERRREPLADGMEHLRQELAARAGAPVHAVVPEVARALTQGGRSDDVCILAIRLAAP